MLSSLYCIVLYVVITHAQTACHRVFCLFKKKKNIYYSHARTYSSALDVVTISGVASGLSALGGYFLYSSHHSGVRFVSVVRSREAVTSLEVSFTLNAC